jgi:hypothetical protein
MWHSQFSEIWVFNRFRIYRETLSHIFRGKLQWRSSLKRHGYWINNRNLQTFATSQTSLDLAAALLALTLVSEERNQNPSRHRSAPKGRLQRLSDRGKS